MSGVSYGDLLLEGHLLGVTDVQWFPLDISLVNLSCWQLCELNDFFKAGNIRKCLNQQFPNNDGKIYDFKVHILNESFYIYFSLIFFVCPLYKQFFL